MPFTATADSFSEQCANLFRQLQAECPSQIDTSKKEDGLLAFKFENCPENSPLKTARLEKRTEVLPKVENNLPKHAACEAMEIRTLPKVGKFGAPMKMERTIRIRRFNRPEVGTVVTKEHMDKSEEGAQWWYDVRGGTVVCLARGNDNYTHCFDYDRETKKFRPVRLLGPMERSYLVTGSKTVQEVAPPLVNTSAESVAIGLALPE